MLTAPIYRGTTVQWSTTFYDLNKNIVQPTGAAIHLQYLDADGNIETATVEMTGPLSPGDVQWTALWDSRGAYPSRVSWSIHTEGGAVPYGVEDGAFDLLANNANLETF